MKKPIYRVTRVNDTYRQVFYKDVLILETFYNYVTDAELIKRLKKEINKQKKIAACFNCSIK
jgi:hypothetical protein